jgi:hypothetical protein
MIDRVQWGVDSTADTAHRSGHPLFSGCRPYGAADLSHSEGVGSLELQDVGGMCGVPGTHKHSILVSRTGQETLKH